MAEYNTFDLGDAAIARFLATVQAPDFVADCARLARCTPDDAAQLFAIYGNEVAVGAGLLRDFDLRGKRVLEVGAGIGLQTCFLLKAGVDLEAIEPQGVGFDQNHALLDALTGRLGITADRVHRIGAESLDPTKHGYYDIIFSVNVLEHVADLDAALAGMTRVLAPGGKMIHACPNYAVPYDPHYALPLMPLAPRWTFWAGARRQEPVWRSLNFVTASRLKRMGQAHGLKTELDPTTMHDAFERVLADPIFAGRHGALGAMARALKATGALGLLRHWPPAFATPMQVTMERIG